MSDEYLAGHLEEALAHEGETDVRVRVASGRVVLTGTVATDQRRDAISSIANDLCDLEVLNEVTVMHCSEPDDAEGIS